MSSKIFQNLVQQIKEVISVKFGLTDEAGYIIACSDETEIGKISPQAQKVLQGMEQFAVFEGIAFQKVFTRNKLEFLTFIENGSEDVSKCLALISINALNIKAYYDEKFDKGSFIKNIITENILTGDIPLKARELHMGYNTHRVVMLVRTEKINETHAYDIIEGLFPNRPKDYISILDDENIALVKELKSGEDFKEVEKSASIIVDTLNTELMVKAYVGVGTIVGNLKDIVNSYKEAQMALLIGRIFERDKLIINYNNLGLGRLIYQIPKSLCKLFLKEVFKEVPFESLDTETMFTIQKFFENSLNVSETSRQLYVHRNTLVYRLDKVEKLTGLDLRKFDDAIIFKVATLVKMYMDGCEEVE